MFRSIFITGAAIVALLTSAYANSIPPHVQSAVEEHLATQLRDPYSARFTFDDHWGPSPTGRFVFCGTVNAKNGFGAYSGPVMFYGTYASAGDFEVSLIKPHMQAMYADLCAGR